MAQFIKIIDEHINRQQVKYYTWDQLAAACTIDANVVCETRKAYASVELHGSSTRGQMVVDLNGDMGKSKNVLIVTRIDQALYEKLMSEAFNLL